jgi:hypothetical protein
MEEEGLQQWLFPEWKVYVSLVCTENLIRVDDVMESSKLAE